MKSANRRSVDHQGVHEVIRKIVESHHPMFTIAFRGPRMVEVFNRNPGEVPRMPVGQSRRAVCQSLLVAQILALPGRGRVAGPRENTIPGLLIGESEPLLLQPTRTEAKDRIRVLDRAN